MGHGLGIASFGNRCACMPTATRILMAYFRCGAVRSARRGQPGVKSRCRVEIVIVANIAVGVSARRKSARAEAASPKPEAAAHGVSHDRRLSPDRRPRLR